MVCKMGKGNGLSTTGTGKEITWDEVKRHTGVHDRWIVIHDKVYDVTRFQRTHPGGARIIGHFAGQDATEVWTAMHRDKTQVEKYMKALYIGDVEHRQLSLPVQKRMEDMEKLRVETEKMGLFEGSRNFFLMSIAQLVVLEVVGYLVMWYFGTSWFPYIASLLLLTAFQAQAGWIQHDYGHWSVFNNRVLNHFLQNIIIGFGKGASKHWWNFRHMQHHAKTNVFKKDPDITLPYIFLLGDKIPVKWGQQKRGLFPYQYEHIYFWLLGPAALLPVYFHLEILYFIFKRRDWKDFLLMVGFFTRHFYLFGPLLGGWGAFKFYMFIRFLESFWFTFVTQMSHIPMDIDVDKEQDWLVAMTTTTCNVEPGLFNDWFSGHLNYQIEHHLFPTMPRHNYHKVRPLVQALCRNHKLPYVEKHLLRAFGDVLGSLKKSGQLWYDAYYHT